MQPSRNVWISAFLTGVFAFVATTGAARAQSIYGCSDLASAQVPALEGRQGVFYRIDPDLMMHNRLSDGAVDRIAAISQALATRGTEMIFVPIPTKSLAMPAHLGDDARDYGYDPVLAATLFEDTVARLASAQVNVVDPRRAMVQHDGEYTIFFRADPRLSSTGLRVLADTIGVALQADAALPSPISTEEVGIAILPSDNMTFLQAKCSAPFAPMQAVALTARGDAVEGATRVVIAGTEISGEPALNFAGLVGERTGMDVSVYTVHGDPVAALTSALLTDDFAATPPDYLVWTVPIWINLMARGDQPLGEALSASLAECTSDLPLQDIGDGQLRIDLRGTLQGAGTAMFLDTRAQARRAEFRFVAADGRWRTRSIWRADDFPALGRFFIPLGGLWAEGSGYADVTADFAPNSTPRAALCAMEVGQ